ncbi:tyrosine-type recombinase/integrase, partial [Pseudomonas aeruginosa]|nr:tyrosine-type recombinase/integrase [Pseudomonas aeruginosa]
PFTVTPHMLRHTYATHTLHDMRRRKSVIDPLLYVRDRLGHSSVATTQRYLHLISMIEDDVMGEYQEFIDSVCVGRI